MGLLSARSGSRCRCPWPNLQAWFRTGADCLDTLIGHGGRPASSGQRAGTRADGPKRWASWPAAITMVRASLGPSSPRCRPHPDTLAGPAFTARKFGQSLPAAIQRCFAASQGTPGAHPSAPAPDARALLYIRSDRSDIRLEHRQLPVQWQRKVRRRNSANGRPTRSSNARAGRSAMTAAGSTRRIECAVRLA